MRIVFFLSFLLLQGCSTTCFVREAPNSEQVDVLYSPHFGSEFQTEDNSKSVRRQDIDNYCQKISGYSYSKGPFLLDPANISNLFCVNCKPKCLVKLAKNDAFKESGNLVTWIYSPYIHGGYRSYITSYTCDDKFQKTLLKKHNKKRNKVDGSVEPPIR